MIEKLKKIKYVEPDNSLSKLAKNFFEKLISVKMSQRYIAKEALQHPWITRKLQSDIPLHNYHRIEKESLLRNKMFLL